MTSGVRVTVRFPTPRGCRLAELAADPDVSIEHTATGFSPPGGGGAVTDVLVDSDGPLADFDGTVVFSYGTTDVYRVPHTGDERCPCAVLGEHDCPIYRYTARDGELTVVFHVEDFERLQSIIADLRDRCAPVNVRSLLQPPLEAESVNSVFVNQGRLTDRQQEVLHTAYERGYFEHPKGANATEIATELGISQSTFSEHLNVAQQKLFSDLFDGQR